MSPPDTPRWYDFFIHHIHQCFVATTGHTSYISLSMDIFYNSGRVAVPHATSEIRLPVLEKLRVEWERHLISMQAEG